MYVGRNRHEKRFYRNKNIMDQMMDMMVTYANNLEDLVHERTRLLYEEKMKTEDLLHRMLPKYVFMSHFPVNVRIDGGCDFLGPSRNA